MVLPCGYAIQSEAALGIGGGNVVRGSPELVVCALQAHDYFAYAGPDAFPDYSSGDSACGGLLLLCGLRRCGHTGGRAASCAKYPQYEVLQGSHGSLQGPEKAF